MKILSLILFMIIAACAVMIGYLMVYIPAECRNLAISSGGSASCGLEPGAYVIAAILGIVAIIAAILLVRQMRTDKGSPPSAGTVLMNVKKGYGQDNPQRVRG